MRIIVSSGAFCKRYLRISFLITLSISFLAIFSGCSTTIPPTIKMQEPLPPIIKEYRHLTLSGGQLGMRDTGIYLKKTQPYSILATGSIDYCPSGTCGYHDVRPEYGWPFMLRIGKNHYLTPLYYVNGFTDVSRLPGKLYVGYREGSVTRLGEPLNPEYYFDDVGAFQVDIFVWNTDDFSKIAEFFQELTETNPENKAITDALKDATILKGIYLAETKTSKEIEKTKKQIKELKVATPEKKQPALSSTSRQKAEYSKQESTAEHEKQEEVKRLEEKLAALMKKLSQLQGTKKKLEEEREKIHLLTEELAQKERKEKDLLAKLQKGSMHPPVIVIASPEDGSEVEADIIRLSGVAEDDEGLEALEIFVNGKLLKTKAGRGLIDVKGKYPKRLNIEERISLEKGENVIRVRATDSDRISSEKKLTIHHIETLRNIWAVVVGIDAYQNAPQLKYAVNDAKAFYRYLLEKDKIPPENVILLLDREANLKRLRSILGTYLKAKARKDDMVILYFAGHGATERDVMSPDGDGLEKYLLPSDADPKDLYASALPMREISHIFHRIRSERLIFIVDSCYSGASGGRTISSPGFRANISEAFLDRIASGKGRIIITASGANEVSEESSALGHGVFTYYLLQGLEGKADTDRDRLITVDELYGYVSKQVPQATGQEQHPVKKGAVEGRLVLGILQ